MQEKANILTTKINNKDVRYVMREGSAYAIFGDVRNAFGLKDAGARKAILRAGLDFNFPNVLANGGVMYLMTNKDGVELLKGLAEKKHPRMSNIAKVMIDHAEKTKKKMHEEDAASRAIVRRRHPDIAPVVAPVTSALTMKSVLSNAFEGHDVRTAVRDDGSVWFVLKDVCGALGIINHNNWPSKLRDDQKDGVRIDDPMGRHQTVTIISESGLYRVIFASRSDKAEEFQDWVTGTVLPSIRKTGGYSEVARQEQPALPTSFAEALLLAGRLEEERSKAVKQIEEDRPKVEFYEAVLSGEGCHDITSIAKELGLPSARALNQLLNVLDVQYFTGGKWELYAPHCGKGYTKNVSETHGGKIRTRLVWTEKGRQFVHDKVNEFRGLLK